MSSDGLKDEEKTTMMMMMTIRAVTEVSDLVATDHQMTIKMEHQLHILQETVQQMLHEDSEQNQFYTKSVPHTHTVSHNRKTSTEV
jgi:hypothetical protein